MRSVLGRSDGIPFDIASTIRATDHSPSFTLSLAHVPRLPLPGNQEPSRFLGPRGNCLAKAPSIATVTRSAGMLNTTAFESMNLGSLLTEDQVIADLSMTERWLAIVELIDHLVSKDNLNSEHRAEILNSLKEREELTSTGIGSGVAIPHAFSENVDKVVAIFGRSTQGIDFEAIDNAPVKFIVLFIVPRNQYQLHLKTLAAIAKMFNNAAIRKSLARAEDSSELLEILTSQRPTTR